MSLGAVGGRSKPACPPRGPRMTELERAAWRIALTFYGEEEADAAECRRDERWERCWHAVWEVLDSPGSMLAEIRHFREMRG